MDRLFSVKDIQERYQVGAVTARRYIREMVHMEKPLMVTESAITAWEKRKLIMPSCMIREEMRRARK